MFLKIKIQDEDGTFVLESHDEVVQILVDAITDIRKRQWLIGDVMVKYLDALAQDAEMQGKKLKRSDILREISQELKIMFGQDMGKAYNLLDEYERIARRWQPEDRCYNVDWSYYRNTDPENEDHRELLQDIADQQISKTEFMNRRYPKTATRKAVIGQVKGIITTFMKHANLPQEVQELIMEKITEIENILPDQEEEEAC